MKLAQRLRELRTHTKMSQPMLADAAGISKQAVSKYENGIIHIPVERAEQMMRVLGFEMRHLYEEPGSPLPPIRFRPPPKRCAAPPSGLTAVPQITLFKLHGAIGIRSRPCILSLAGATHVRCPTGAGITSFRSC